jgi:hypothetical protein
MSLPKIELPLYELILPSNGKKVQYRPFTVKEEKILLTAQQSKDPEQIIMAIKQIVNNCIQDYDVDKLALFDLEYLLINIRSRSVDNNVEFEIDDPDTQEKIKLTLDLQNVKVYRDEKHTNKISLDEKYTIFLKYPSIDDFTEILDKQDLSPEKSYEILISCIDMLASENEVYNFKDFTKKQVDEFIESLHADVIKKIKTFFDTMPKVRHEMPYKNSKGKDKVFTIQGTQSFFI